MIGFVRFESFFVSLRRDTPSVWWLIVRPIAVGDDLHIFSCRSAFVGVLLLVFRSNAWFQCHFERWATQFRCWIAVIVVKMKRFRSELFRLNQFKSVLLHHFFELLSNCMHGVSKGHDVWAGRESIKIGLRCNNSRGFPPIKWKILRLRRRCQKSLLLRAKNEINVKSLCVIALPSNELRCTFMSEWQSALFLNGRARLLRILFMGFDFQPTIDDYLTSLKMILSIVIIAMTRPLNSTAHRHAFYAVDAVRRVLGYVSAALSWCDASNTERVKHGNTLVTHRSSRLHFYDRNWQPRKIKSTHQATWTKPSPKQ